MKVLLCSVVKAQNRYLKEWVEHYYNLGFSNIYLFDNNDIENGENINDVIQGYIDSGFVIVDDTIKGVPFTDSIQENIYNKCYAEQSKNYDWIAFYDTDEYLCLQKNKTVGEWLSNKLYNKYHGVAINWKTYTDNDIFFESSIKNANQYTEYITDKRVKDSVRTKCVYKTNIAELSGKICIHGNTANIKLCNPLGSPIQNSKYPYFIQKLDVAYLKHLKYRSVESVCKKIKLFVVQHKSYGQQILDEYIQMNKMTKEKAKYLIDSLKDTGLDLKGLE